MILKGFTIHGHRAKHKIASLQNQRLSVRMVGSCKARVPRSFREQMKWHLSMIQLFLVSYHIARPRHSDTCDRRCGFASNALAISDFCARLEQLSVPFDYARIANRILDSLVPRKSGASTPHDVLAPMQGGKHSQLPNDVPTYQMGS